MSHPLQSIFAWFHAAAMALPGSAILIVSHILAVGSLFPRSDGTFVIAACLSYRTLQQRCGLSSAGVTAGVRAAVRSGWLVRPPRVGSTVPAIYAVPIPTELIKSTAPALESKVVRPPATNETATRTLESKAPCTNGPAEKNNGALESKVLPFSPPERPALYAASLPESQRLQFEIARQVDGVDGEMAFLRNLFDQAIAQHPDQIDLLLRIANGISRLARTRHLLSNQGRSRSVQEAIQNVFDNLFRSAGIDPAAFIVRATNPEPPPGPAPSPGNTQATPSLSLGDTQTNPSPSMGDTQTNPSPSMGEAG